MNHPYFSVIIPVYNKEPHISRTIKSVLNQTFKNFELIIVCDPSTDNSNEEVKKFTDPRIKVYCRNEPGPGGYAARNLGIKKATTEWIAFLDADDEWYPEHLENYSNLIKVYPNITFFSCAYMIKGESGNIEANDYYKSLSDKQTHELDFLAYLKLATKGNRLAWTSVVCLKNTSSIKDLFPEGKAERGGDQFAWVKYLSIEKKLLWSNHFGAIYHKDSINMVTKSAPSNPDLLKYEYNLLHKTLPDEEKKYLIKFINRRLSGSYFRNIIENNEKICKIHKSLFFKYDEMYYLVNVVISFFPIHLYKYLKKLKNLYL